MTHHHTGIFSISTHLAVSLPEKWSGPNVMPYPDVLSNNTHTHTHTHTHTQIHRIGLVQINVSDDQCDNLTGGFAPHHTGFENVINSFTSALVQTAERCRLFVIVRDRSKLHPEYGGSWHQPARKERCHNPDVSVSISIRTISWRRRGKGKYSSTDSLTSALDAAKWKASWAGLSLRRWEYWIRRHIRESHETQSRSVSCGEEKIPSVCRETNLCQPFATLSEWSQAT